MVRGEPSNHQEAHLYISKLVLATIFGIREYQDAVKSAQPAPARLREDSLTLKLKESGIISKDYTVAVTKTDNVLMLQAETGLVGVERETQDGQIDKSYHIIDLYTPSQTLDLRCYVFGDVLQGDSLEYTIKEQEIVFEPKIIRQAGASGSDSRAKIKEKAPITEERTITYHFDKGDPRWLSLNPIAQTITQPSNITFRDGKVELGKVVKFSIGRQLGSTWVDGMIPPWAYYHVKEVRNNVVELSVYLPNHH